MPERRGPGLLLRMRSLGESDALAEFFTRDLGRLTTVVKGAKRSQKRFFGLLLSGHYLELTLAATRWGDLWRLQAASMLNAHLGLRQDYRRLLAAGPVLELLLRATALHDPQPGALHLALVSLARLERGREPGELADALLIFLTRLLAELGYGLQLERCVICGRPQARLRGLRLCQEGGLACGGCQPAGPVLPAKPGLLKGLAAAQSLEPEALARLRFAPGLAQPAIAFLAGLWRNITGRDLPSLDLAQTVLTPAPPRSASSGRSASVRVVS